MPAHQRNEVAAVNARQHRRVGDLVAVEVQDGQHRAVARRVQEFVGIPARRQRPGFGLAVANDAGHDQTRVVKGSAVGMGERIAQLAAFVDRAWGLGRDMAGNATGPRELAKQPPHAAAVAFDGRVVLGVGAFKVGVGNDARPAMAGADHQQHVKLMRLDQPVQVHIDQVQSGRGAPMPEQAPLDVLQRQRRLQQRVVLQVDLSHRQVVGSAPPGVHFVEHVGCEGVRHGGSPQIGNGTSKARSTDRAVCAGVALEPVCSFHGDCLARWAGLLSEAKPTARQTKKAPSNGALGGQGAGGAAQGASL